MADLTRELRRGVHRVVDIREDEIAADVERPVEFGRAARADTRDEPHELDGKVVADHLEDVDVVGARRLGAFPAHLEHTEHLGPIEHRDADLASIGRHVLHAQKMLRMVVEVGEHARDGTLLVRPLLDGETASARLPQHIRRDPGTIGDELG